MSLKSVFDKAVQKTRDFFQDIEASQLESQIEMAKAGYLLCDGMGRFVQVVELTPETAQNTINACQKRLAELRKPSPANP